MKLLNLFLIINISISLPCVGQNEIKIDTSMGLDNQEMREKFLTELYDADQEVRNIEIEISQNQFGTIPHAQSKINMLQTDLDNLIKLTSYLREYGYPNTSDFSSKAKICPWLIFHHNAGTVKSIDKEFAPLLVSQYLENNLDEVKLLWYLKRYYLSYMGIPYQRTIAKNEAEDIQELIKMLKINYIHRKD